MHLFLGCAAKLPSSRAICVRTCARAESLNDQCQVY